MALSPVLFFLGHGSDLGPTSGPLHVTVISAHMNGQRYLFYLLDELKTWFGFFFERHESSSKFRFFCFWDFKL